MKVTKIIFELDDGSSRYITNEIDIKNVVNGCPAKWINLRKTATKKELHDKYFGMLNDMLKDLKLGYSKGSFHNVIKPLLFGYLKDQTHLFTNNVFEDSTKNLTVEGYSTLIDLLKEVANDIYNYQFKE